MKNPNAAPPVPQVFISSTAEDLKDYRTATRDTVLRDRMHPEMMEYFVASGRHPPLDECLNRVAATDVLLVIVAHRYGWVPPDQDDDEHKSITWLECEQAVADGHEVLAFVVDDQQTWPAEQREENQISAAILTGTATPKLLETIQQNVARLRDFKNWLDSLGIRARFTSSADLRAHVSHALHEWRNRQTKFALPQPVADSQHNAQPSIPPSYVEWLQRQCADIELLGLHEKQSTAVQLNNVYVPVTTAARREEPNLSEDDRAGTSAAERALRGEEQKPQLLLDLLAAESLYVYGPPGSGKSTFCRWVAWLTCSGDMPDQPVPPPDGYVETFPDAFRDRLPLLVRLRDFWSDLPKSPGGRALSRPQLEDSLGRWLEGKRPGELTSQCFQSHLAGGSLLIILDGVDEVPITVGEDDEAYHPREILLAGLMDALSQWTSRGNRVLVTSRPYGVSETDAARLALKTAAVTDLDAPVQQLLVRRWFGALARDAVQGRQTAQAMLDHIAQRDELQPLISNPMLLTAMCVIYHQGKRLPQHRHDLYDRILDNVLHNRYANDQKVIALVRNRLSVVADGMHTGAGLDEQRTTPQAEATYAEIDRMVQRYRDESPATEPGFMGAVETREDLLNNSGVLLPRDGKKAGFYHFTFQDFLAAQVLLEREADLAELFRRRAGTSEWRSTLSFVYSSLLARHTLPDKAIHLLEGLIDPLTHDDLGLAVVVADCLEILAGSGFGLRDDYMDRFRGLCLAAIEQEVSLGQRFDLGLALGHLGDPRIVDDLRDHNNEKSWVEIPAGDYVVGKERTPHRIERPFWITRFPVTNGQYRFFLEEGGYDEDAPWWSDDGREWLRRDKPREPVYWTDSKWNHSNQPVVGVSFWEAEAFAAWAGGRLPGEFEWEAAARGPEGLEYPWGERWEDDICNYGKVELRRTSPVGLFARSRSTAFALEDMAGNVWEWCTELYDSTSEVVREARVLRGGSWIDYASDCRAAARVRDPPGLRDSAVGFRLLFSRQDSK